MKRTAQGVLIMAGGTGGHIFPGLAVADVLKRKNIPVRWLGAAGGMETRKVPDAGIELDLVTITGLRGKGMMRWIRMPFQLFRAVWQARRLLDNHRPSCAVSFGGYVAAPGGIAAWTKGIPVIVHEQNRIPGLTNRVLARISCRILQGFPDTFPEKLQAVTSGNPVRDEMMGVANPQDRLSGRKGPVRVLVTGGSQGAQVLNLVVPAALALLPADTKVEVIHQAGEKRVDEATQAYTNAGVKADIKPFISDMAASYSWADLVICRSGALTVAELAASGSASVLVPYAYAVDDHQTRNAEYLSAENAAMIMPHASFDPLALANVLQPLFADREILMSMACAARKLAMPKAAEKVADACLQSVKT